MERVKFNQLKDKILSEISDKKLYNMCNRVYNFKNFERAEGIEIIIDSPTVSISTYQLFGYDEKTKMWSSSSTITQSNYYLTGLQINELKKLIGV